MKENNSFDAIVIGAGIQGAGVAQALSVNGWRVMVIEKGREAACETSSKSSKLIHGGLRYLESLEFGLVKSCLAEQKYLLSSAPDIVKLKPFYIPICQGAKRSPIIIAIGLYLYSLLKKDYFGQTFSVLPKQNSEAFPFLRKTGLKRIAKYYDAQTDDKILTRRVCESAKKYGACFNYNESVIALNVGERQYTATTTKGKYTSRVLINAAGPWVNEIVKCAVTPLPKLDIELVQGTHIVVDVPSFNECYYIESPEDQRAVFVLPWYGKTMIGTTETQYQGDPDKQSVPKEDTQYLLRTFNYYFPQLDCREANIIDCFSGLRVLPAGASSAHKRSRETQLITDESVPGYLAIYGGKLTMFRSTAEKAVKLMRPSLPKRNTLVDTTQIKI